MASPASNEPRDDKQPHEAPASDRPEPRDGDPKSDDQPRKPKRRGRPGLVIGPTTGDADVQLEW